MSRTFLPAAGSLSTVHLASGAQVGGSRAIAAASDCDTALQMIESASDLIADLARRQLVVVERQGQAHIVRFCAKVTPWVKPGS